MGISLQTTKLRVIGLCGRGDSPVSFPHKGPVTRKILPFDDVIMIRKIKQDAVDFLSLNHSALSPYHTYTRVLMADCWVPLSHISTDYLNHLEGYHLEGFDEG